ncbi:MAG: hypothetical protein GEV07_00600 [Streptosporangiales bacterium]|nr:hypothetical protein [Streptosporangiales bacterium]
MATFTTTAGAEALVASLNENEAFERETRWFDGSVLLESSGGQCWLKVYRGKVIDHLPFMPPLGYTFKVSGPDEAWAELVAGRRLFADLVTPGQRYFADDPELATLGVMTSDLRVEGNVMEANRLTEAVYQLAETYARTAATRSS